jgi:hypothetical protein
MTARHTISGPRLNVNRITITEEISVRSELRNRTAGAGIEGVSTVSRGGDRLGRRAHAGERGLPEIWRQLCAGASRWPFTC